MKYFYCKLNHIITHIMILKFRLATILSLVALTVVIYSSCKKDSTSVKTNNDAEIARSIAVNFYNSIGSTIASKNTVTGIPTVNSVRNGIKVNDLTCGETINQPFNNTYTKGDSVKDVMTGANKFVVSCDAQNQPNGYTYTGKYVNTGFSPYSTYDNSVDEQYTLKALLPEYAKMEVNGTQTSVYKFTTKKDNEYMVQNNSYVLKGIIIDAASRPFDITAGTATFVSKGNNAGKDFNFAGTIQYLGNHKAKVSFDGKSFDIEIL
jgi:hypothetical protein